MTGAEAGVLLLDHFDTVWPAGTTAQWSMTVVDGVARGPEMFDIKAGIVQMAWWPAAMPVHDDPHLELSAYGHSPSG